MVTKAFVQEVIDPYHLRVRIPLYNKIESVNGSTPNSELSVAAVCTLPNFVTDVKSGSIVILSFEEDDISKPIVLGHLATANASSSIVDIKCNDLHVVGETTLTELTTIGEVTGDSIQQLKGLDTNVKQKFLEVDKEFEDIEDEFEKVNECIEELEDTDSIFKMYFTNIGEILGLNDSTMSADVAKNQFKGPIVLPSNSYGKKVPTGGKLGELHFVLMSELEGAITEGLEIGVLVEGSSEFNSIIGRSGYSVKDFNFEQLIIVETKGESTSATINAFEISNGVWTKASVLTNVTGVVGEEGVGDADEYHSFTPEGVHSLGTGFGICENPGTKLDWFDVTKNSYWVTDPECPDEYNQHIEYSGNPPWKSYEHLIDFPIAYRYCVFIEYNYPKLPNKPTPGEGSAFFLHCATGRYTGGCVAIPESDMIDALRWLDKDKNPHILIFST
jgi:L,D-peptidoglycan transpeptidase YkuD (ErfK/YbiS/YcfS/YnhG family)